LWIGIFANAVFPLGELVFNVIFFYYIDYLHEIPPEVVRIGETLSILGMFLTQIVSGCVLIWSVITVFI